MPANATNQIDNRVTQQAPRAIKSQPLPNRPSKQLGQVEKNSSIRNGPDKSPPRRLIDNERNPTKQQRNNNGTKPDTRREHLNHLDASGTTVPPLDLSAAGNHRQTRLPPGAISSSTATCGEVSRSSNVILTTRRAYEQRRGLGTRDYAVQCLTLAQRFDKLSWLGQVRQAVEIAKVGVRRVYNSEDHLFVAAAGNNGDDPQATVMTEHKAVAVGDK